MKRWRIIALVAALALTCVMGACAPSEVTTPPEEGATLPEEGTPLPPEEEGAPPAEEVLPTVDEVINNSIATMDEVTTWRSATSMDIFMEFSGPQTGESTTKIRDTGAIDLDDREMEGVTSTSIVSDDEWLGMVTATYFVDDTIYVMTITPYVGEQWMKQKFSGDEVETVWETLTSAMPVAADMLAACYFESLSTEEVSGMPCYLLKGSQDVQEVSKLMEQVVGSSETLPFDYSEMFQNVVVSYWIATDTYYLVKANTTATMLMEVEGVKFEGDLVSTTSFYDYNKEVFIELPPEAAEAMEMP